MRARVEAAHGRLEAGERDAREALGLAASRKCHVLIPDILEILADLAGTHWQLPRRDAAPRGG